MSSRSTLGGWWRGLFGTVLLAACVGPAVPVLDEGADTDSDGIPDTKPGVDDDTDGPTGEEIVEGCTDLCWGWDTPPLLPPPGTGPVVSEIKDCNAGGYQPGVCPGGFVCGDPVTLAYGPQYAISLPVCEGQRTPYRLVADIDSTPEPPEGVEVSLVFTLAGERWPGGGEPGQAGFLSLTGTTTETSVVVEMPVVPSGRVRTQLPPDTYVARFLPGPGLDDSVWPIVGRTGVLAVVAGDEEVQIDVLARPVSLRVLVDGVRQSVLDATTNSTSMTLTGHRTLTVVKSTTTGNSLDRTVVLPFDTFDLTFSVYPTTAASPFPGGGIHVPDALVVDEEGPERADFDLPTETVSGSVRINGGAHAGIALSSVTWQGKYGGDTFSVTGTNPGSYAGRVWPGTYDVTLSTIGGSGQGLPIGSAVLHRQVAPGVRNLDVGTVAVDGKVTLNGGTPTGGSRGFVFFRNHAGHSAQLLLKSSGDAAYAGTVFAGRGDIVVEGDGSHLPEGSVVAASDVAFGGSRTIDIRAWPVSVTLKVDGSTATGDGDSRGQVTFTRIDPSTREPQESAPGSQEWVTIDASIASTGPATATRLLGPGSYRVSSYTYEAGGLPASSVVLGELDVDGPDAATYNLNTVQVDVDLLLDGAAIPVPGSGNRGRIFVGNNVRELPRTGPTQVRFKVVKDEVVWMYWLCSAAWECALEEQTRTLWSAISF